MPYQLLIIGFFYLCFRFVAPPSASMTYLTYTFMPTAAWIPMQFTGNPSAQRHSPRLQPVIVGQKFTHLSHRTEPQAT